MAATNGSGGEDSGRAAGQWRWWHHLGWLLLPAWFPPLAWGGWWWLLVVLLIPAQIGWMVLLFATADERRLDRRAATASAIPPGDPLDVGCGRPAGAGRLPSPGRGRLASDAVARHLVAGVGQVCGLAQHPTGAWLAVGGTDGRVQLWAGIGTAEPAPVAAMAHRAPVSALAASPDGRLLATTGTGGTLTVWDVTRPENPHCVLTLVQPSGCRTLPALDLGPGGLLAFGGENGQIVVWDLSRPGLLRRVGQIRLAPQVVPRGGLTGAFAVRFSPDGRFLVAGGRPRNGAPARIWRLDDPQGPRPVAKLQPHRTAMFGTEPPMCHDLAFSPRRSLLVTASEYDYRVHTGDYDYYHPQLHDSAVVIWDVHDPSRPRGLVTLGERGGDTPTGWRNRPNRASPTTLAGHADTARVVSISPDDTRLATGSDDHHVLVWDITDPADPACLATLACTGPMRALAFTPDSRFLISAADDDDRVTIWDPPRTGSNRVTGS